MKYMLVKAPEGLGFHLSHQNPKIYVTGRPYVVQNDNQVQIGKGRNSLIVLGETEMTDEEFFEAYKKDPKVAIASAVIDNEKVNKVAVKAAAGSATKAKAKAAQIKKDEAARVAKEKATREADEARIAKEQAAAAKEG